MLKKIFLGTLFAAVIGLLIFGAVTRTNAKLGYESDTTASLTRGQGAAGQGRLELENKDSYDHVYDDLTVNNNLRGGRGGGEGQGQGQGREQEQYSDGTGTGVPQPQANVTEWLTLTGTVTSVDADQLTVQTDDGKQIVIENRAWWFATEQGFETNAGHQVSLTGFYDEDVFEAATISDQTSQLTVTLRDENGRPMWAGRGRGRSG